MDPTADRRRCARAASQVVHVLPKAAHCHQVLVEPKPAHGCWSGLVRRSTVNGQHDPAILPVDVIVEPVERPARHLQTRATALTDLAAVIEASAPASAAKLGS